MGRNWALLFLCPASSQREALTKPNNDNNNDWQGSENERNVMCMIIHVIYDLHGIKEENIPTDQKHLLAKVQDGRARAAQVYFGDRCLTLDPAGEADLELRGFFRQTPHELQDISPKRVQFYEMFPIHEIMVHPTPGLYDDRFLLPTMRRELNKMEREVPVNALVDLRIAEGVLQIVIEGSTSSVEEAWDFILALRSGKPRLKPTVSFVA
ncbi:MAG: hypothetical protein M1338_00435 [Patescibacteria group bacterium]|nr:hypothetical protein [Patescibacteria group bacterium]